MQYYILLSNTSRNISTETLMMMERSYCILQHWKQLPVSQLLCLIIVGFKKLYTVLMTNSLRNIPCLSNSFCGRSISAIFRRPLIGTSSLSFSAMLPLFSLPVLILNLRSSSSAALWHNFLISDSVCLINRDTMLGLTRIVFPCLFHQMNLEDDVSIWLYKLEPFSFDLIRWMNIIKLIDQIRSFQIHLEIYLPLKIKNA